MSVLLTLFVNSVKSITTTLSQQNMRNFDKFTEVTNLMKMKCVKSSKSISCCMSYDCLCCLFRRQCSSAQSCQFQFFCSAVSLSVSARCPSTSNGCPMCLISGMVYIWIKRLVWSIALCYCDTPATLVKYFTIEKSKYLLQACRK